jgi:N-dimethylarginine dimethylaminohydrolase
MIRNRTLGLTHVPMSDTGPRLLMCRPEHFGVTYTINPWMDPGGWARNSDQLIPASQREWEALYRILVNLGAVIELVPPAPGLPDLVFTANAAVVLDRRVLLARFRHPERQGEEPRFEAAFRELQARGLVDEIVALPRDLVLEGAGDCVWDATRNMFWTGYGPRSSRAASPVVEDAFGVDAVALELADPRFYHLDTALRPLANGDVMYAPLAFTDEGLAAIRDRVAPEERVEIDADDACRLAANAVLIGDTVVLSSCSGRLRARLGERGYQIAATPLPSFLRSGGSAFCLTLRLDRQSAATRPYRSRPQTIQDPISDFVLETGAEGSRPGAH